MEIIYTGAHLETEITATGQIATREVPIDVREDVARSLLEQETWTAYEPAPRREGGSK